VSKGKCERVAQTGCRGATVRLHELSVNLGLLASLLLTAAALPLWAAAPPIVPVRIDPGLPGAGSTDSFRINASTDSVEIPVRPLSPDAETSCHALTVVFDDNGDGGPVVEWLAADSEATLLSAGLGTLGTGSGTEARTLLLPQNLTLPGGTLRVSFAGRFGRLRTIELLPCAEITVAAPPDRGDAVMVNNTGRVLSGNEVSGGEAPLLRGDLTHGRVVRAELSASPIPLGEASPVEVIVPMESVAGESFLRAELSGLDPSSRVEVAVNGTSLGPLGMEPFPLDDAATIRSPSGRLVRAGWRAGAAFVPAGLWKQGENSVVLSLRRSGDDPGTPVRLRNAVAELLFTGSNAGYATAGSSHDSPAPAETLSNGSAYGNPSRSLFHATLPPPIAADETPVAP